MLGSTPTLRSVFVQSIWTLDSIDDTTDPDKAIGKIKVFCPEKQTNGKDCIVFILLLAWLPNSHVL